MIKVGTRTIVGKNGLNHQKIKNLMDEVAWVFQEGHEVILVSSGAIGTGLSFVHCVGPREKKVAAAVGQPFLMHHYIREAKKHKISVGQILLLSGDVTNKERFKNLVLNIEAIIECRVLPIINENDIMKGEDLLVGDNDTLSAMVAVGLKADKLIILTNQNGLYTGNPDHNKNAKLIKNVAKIDSKIEALCRVGKSDLGVGGMSVKVQAAKYATERGVETLIGNGDKNGTIIGALGKNFSGTRFMIKNNPSSRAKLTTGQE